MWNSRMINFASVVAALATAAVAAVLLPSETTRAPDDRPTVCPDGCAFRSVQRAIDVAAEGDTIVLSPGTYVGPLTIDKDIHLLAESYDADEPRNNPTVIDGDRAPAAITIPSDATGEPRLTGLVIRNAAEDGISPRSPFTLEHSYLTGAQDLIDLEAGAGGAIRGNVFESAGDDAVDLDNPSVDLLVEDNRILDSSDDGIEIRLQDDRLPDLVTTTIRGNEIRGSGEDGIQFIDYAEDTNRLFVVRDNLIVASADAAIGLMDDENTKEDLRAASIREPIDVVGNTIVDNGAGISGGDNLIAVNNLIVGSRSFGLKDVDGRSKVAYNLLFANTPDLAGTNNVDAATILHVDPRLGADQRLRAGSPAIDAGTEWFAWNGRTAVSLTAAEYEGEAPDLGRYEHDRGPSGAAGGPPSVDPLEEAPVVTIAGDIANAGPNDDATADLIGRIDPDYVLTSGDNAYGAGTEQEYLEYYHPSWGRFLGMTRPAPGNHDYESEPPYYYTYFAHQLPAENGGRYYAFDVGAWRLYSLNCEEDCSASSHQVAWLREDLATNGAGRHKMAYLHRPRYSCGNAHGSSTRPAALWDELLAARADIVVASHDHHYERFARMDSAGNGSNDGIVQFIAGTGGGTLRGFDTSHEGCALSQVRHKGAFGVLELTLGYNDFAWRFVTVDDTVLDSGTAATLDALPSP